MSNQQYRDVPDGRYTVAVERLDRTLSRTSGAPMLNIRFRIKEGDFSGCCLFMHQVYRSPFGVLIAAKNLQAICRECGVPMPVPSDVDAATLESVIDTLATQVNDTQLYSLNYRTNARRPEFHDFYIDPLRKTAPRPAPTAAPAPVPTAESFDDSDVVPF